MVIVILVLAVAVPIDRVRVPTARAAIGCSLSKGNVPEIIADAMEITQSIQDGFNSLSLVARKRTFVRLYSHVALPRLFPRLPKGSADARRQPQAADSCISDATLTVTNGGRTVTLEPLEADGVDTVGDKRVDRFLRGDPAFGFLFELPTFALTGQTLLRAEVNPNGTIPEANRANNVLGGGAPISFIDVPRLSLSVDRLSYSVGTSTFSTPLGDVAQLARWIQRAYPVPGVDWRSRAISVGARNVDSNNEFTDLTCDDVNFQRLVDDVGLFNLPGILNLQASNRRLYSMIDDAGGFMRGCALLDDSPFGPIASGPTGTPGGNWSWDTDGIYGDWYGAHEIGHTLDRKHVLCDGTEAGAGPWPYPNGLISAQGSNGEAAVGFDAETRETYPFDVGHDIMTYCAEQWVSDASYKLFGSTILQAGPTGDEPSFEGGDDICVAGTLGLGKASAEQTRLFPTFGGEASSISSVRGKKKKGKFAIELRDASGELITRERFTPVTSRSGAAYLGTRERTKKSLNVLRCLPFDPRVTDVVVTGPGRKPLGTIDAGVSAPTVVVLSPGTTEPSAPPSASPSPTPTPPIILFSNATSNVEPAAPSSGVVSLSWIASDPDGDELSSLVQASKDGGRSWHTVSAPTTATTIDIPRENLSSGATLFRVLTTDGIRVSSDVLDNIVLIATEPPLLEIRSPNNSDHFRTRQTVGLEAFAYDVDTGSLDGNAVRWTSDRDGFLGIGDQVSVTGLSPGAHVITVQATAPGGTTTRSVPIVIE